MVGAFVRVIVFGGPAVYFTWLVWDHINRVFPNLIF